MSTLFMLLATNMACVYYSKPFELPGSDAQQKTFAQARRDVFPAQVRDDPAAYANTFVAWAGIVKDAQVVGEGEDASLVIVVAHHYFDWIEDHGHQREIFFLSPRGEGDFVVVRDVPAEEIGSWRAEASNHVGKMLVAMGRPGAPQPAPGGSFVIPLMDGFYVMFREGAFRTDWIDYGRPGELPKPIPGGMPARH